MARPGRCEGIVRVGLRNRQPTPQPPGREVLSGAGRPGTGPIDPSAVFIVLRRSASRGRWPGRGDTGHGQRPLRVGGGFGVGHG